MADSSSLRASAPAVFTRTQVLAMSSREIAELTGKEHKNVLVDIRSMLDSLGATSAEFSAHVQVPGPNGAVRQAPIFNLPKRETLILVSGYSVALRAKIIDRWQELEAGASNTPQTFAQALRLAAEQAEVMEQQRAQLEIAQPKATALDRLSLADGSVCITNAAKDLQVQPKKLFAWLQVHKWIYRRLGGKGWLAYQDRIQSGHLEHKVTTVERSDGTEKVVEQVLVTPKGLTTLGCRFAVESVKGK